MNFKVGDKVRVKSDLKVGDGRDCVTAVEEMLEYRNKIMTIKGMIKHSTFDGSSYFSYDLDGGGGWSWTEEMFEPIKIEIPTFQPTSARDLIDSIIDAWAKLGHTIIPKEDSTMTNTFITVDGIRIDKTCNEQIPTKYTMAWGTDGTSAVTVCDKAEYDAHTGALVAAAKITAHKSEEAMLMYNLAMNMWGTDMCTAILKTLADRAMGGSFENVYKKWQRQIEQEEKKRHKDSITCSICGRWYNEGEDGKIYPFTPAEREEHEKWHEANRKAKRIRYQERSEAKKRIAEAEREGRITEYMTELLEERKKNDEKKNEE